MRGYSAITLPGINQYHLRKRKPVASFHAPFFGADHSPRKRKSRGKGGPITMKTPDAETPENAVAGKVLIRKMIMNISNAFSKKNFSICEREMNKDE
ncbi:hypothetical protein Y032_0040g339 [Ancylostoma ceylanicum]|nr:hypothetical protein Y032_0040g339 [Ancylostoma ceylanicum]